MSKEARTIVLSDHAQAKVAECIDAIAACAFGDDGPPLETTFAEIEAFSHEAGRMIARGLDEQLTVQHAEHFQGPATCPGCQTSCDPQENPATRELQTTDGQVALHEPVYHCSVCHRDFFPSAFGVEAGRSLV